MTTRTFWFGAIWVNICGFFLCSDCQATSHWTQRGAGINICVFYWAPNAVNI